MLKVFIGYDKAEVAAYQVCHYSIVKNATKPVAIIPLNIRHIMDWFNNADYKSSTEFAFSRFLVPHLCQFAGQAVFMDCDMLVRSDIHEILKYHNPDNAVSVVKHDYQPKEQDKFLGQLQTVYPMKNWSSVMVFENKNCKALDTGFVNNATGLSLHRFKWVPEGKIGSLPPSWNYLVGEDGDPVHDPDIVHFTRGGPYFDQFKNCEYANEWFQYWKESNSVLDQKLVGG